MLTFCAHYSHLDFPSVNMSTSELDSRNITISMRKSVENLVISSQDAIGQSISQALTFSGVITNQPTQDNKNVSRSPSPSPRAASDPPELVVENDKAPEAAAAAAAAECAPATAPAPPDAPGSVSAPASAAIRTDPPKFAGAAQSRDTVSVAGSAGSGGSAGAGGGGGGGGAGAARAKKKSWYNSLYPTYKNKSDDFKRLFNYLPDDERLIVDYSCALQKEILTHGRLYASQNYLCFYASIFTWETSLALRWKDVTAITKEKTALVIPNAILVCRGEEKHFLASFSGRDKAYLMLFRIWQNALMDQPMTSHEIWQWVHSCYGSELGFASDDEGYARDAPAAADPDGDIASLAEDAADSSMETGGEDRPPRTPRDTSPPLVLNGDAAAAAGGDALPTDGSDTTDSENDKPHNGTDGEQCPSPHTGKVLLQAHFNIDIDQIFTMMFTNSKFNLELLATRGTTDYVQAPWQASGGLKVRQVSYTLGLTSGPIGPKEVHVTETQTMNKCSRPGHCYSIDASSENAGIPYADYFTVEVHYCLRRRERGTDLALYGHVKYKKHMWPMVKTFLEKNAISGLEEFARLLSARLTAEGDAAPARKPRRPRRLNAASQEASSSAAGLPVSRAAAALAAAGDPRLSGARAAGGGGGRAGRLLPAALAVLLALNAALYWKLQQPRHHIDLEDLHARLASLGGAGVGGAGAGAGAGGAAVSEWAAAVARHAARQQGELRAWRDALRTTVAHLAQTEQALRQLLETIKPSLEKAQRDAERGDGGTDEGTDGGTSSGTDSGTSEQSASTTTGTESERPIRERTRGEL